MTQSNRKFRYEYPPMEAHFISAPSADAVVKFIQRTYPHNFEQVLPTVVEIPDWPQFWRTLDASGRALPHKQSGG